MASPVDARRAFENLFTVEPKPAVAVPRPRGPVILVQPEKQTKKLLHAASFVVHATGDAPMTFQWRRDGENLAAGLKTQGVEGDGFLTFQSVYSHTAESIDDNGSEFDVVVTNAVGSVTSNPATLLVTRAREKTELEHAAAFHQVPNRVIAKIKSKERRIKNGAYDFEKEEAAEAEEARFQPHQFYNKLKPAFDSTYNVKPGERAFNKVKTGVASRGVDAEGNVNDAFAATFGGLSGGTKLSVTSIESDPAGQGHRPDTPAWLLDKSCLRELLLRLATKKMKPADRFVESVDIRPAEKDRVAAAGLDYRILYWYYRLRREDKEIFERFEDEFREEKGRKGVTSSAGAVQRRRDRLVKNGNALFLMQPKNG